MYTNVTSLSEAQLPQETLERFTQAWQQISEEARAKLIAFGVVHPGDLFQVRDVMYLGYTLYGKPMDLDTQEAYLEFREAFVLTVTEELGLRKPLHKGKVLTFRQRPKM